MQDLILFMLEADQFIRGSAVDMLEHPWLMVSHLYPFKYKHTINQKIVCI